jgi:hypothetical protein
MQPIASAVFPRYWTSIDRLALAATSSNREKGGEDLGELPIHLTSKGL